MIKKIVTFILNFFLFVCVFGTASLFVLSHTVFNEQYVLDILEEKNYYEKTYYQIKDGFGEYVLQAGLEESDLEGIYDVKQVETDVKKVIDAIYNNREVDINTDSMIQVLDNRINDKLKENNRVPEMEERQSIKIFEDTISEVYVNNTLLVNNYIGEISKILNKLMLIVNKIYNIGLISIGVLIIIILLVNRNFGESLKILGTTCLSVGILSASIKMLVGDRIKNILVLNALFSETIVELVYSIVDMFFKMGIMFLIIGIIAIILGCLIRIIKEKKHEDE